MKDFHWGVSSAAPQTEGTVAGDGKGKSVWDEFASRRNKISDGSNPSVATDFYTRYKEDVDIIHELGIPNFRFSISWPRIIPYGTGEINQKGIDFYNNLIDYCLLKNITPWVTLYHWDLPQILEQKGGWTNRSIIEWFTGYTKICIEHFGDRVKNWIVMNEPMAFTGAGYLLGVHAPGKRGRNNFLPAAHHAVLANATASKIIRAGVKDAFIGTAFSFSHVIPYSENKNDILAASRVDDMLNNFFLYAMTGKNYPLENLKFLKGIRKVMLPGDESLMKADLDFIGIQNYTREVIKHSWVTPFIKATTVNAKKRNMPVTEMGWEVYPQAIYHVLKKLSAIKGIPSLIVTENGAAFADDIDADGTIKDTKRKDFIHQNVEQVLKAKSEGVDIRGYFVWSLTDNFEWAEGYRPRFGLVYVDYKNNLKRIIKESGKWYGKMIKNDLY